MKIAGVKVIYFVDVDEFELNRYIESQGGNPYGDIDFIFPYFEFTGYELTEVDAYGDHVMTYTFDHVPTEDEIKKLESLIICQENLINGFIEESKKV